MKTNIIPSLRRTLFVACASVAIPLQAQAQIASDNAANYGTTGNWTNSSNLGTGFGGWGITNTPGSGSAGNFIGDPSAAGITGMSATSFGFMPTLPILEQMRLQAAVSAPRYWMDKPSVFNGVSIGIATQQVPTAVST